MPIFWALVGTPTTRAWMVINPLEDVHYGMASSLPSFCWWNPLSGPWPAMISGPTPGEASKLCGPQQPLLPESGLAGRAAPRIGWWEHWLGIINLMLSPLMMGTHSIWGTLNLISFRKNASNQSLAHIIQKKIWTIYTLDFPVERHQSVAESQNRNEWDTHSSFFKYPPVI